MQGKINEYPDKGYTAQTSGQNTITQQAFSSIKDFVANKGYTILEYPNSIGDVVPLCELSPAEESFKPRVMICYSSSGIQHVNPNSIQSARTFAQQKSIPLIAFTSDGKTYRTLASTGSSNNGLDFLPLSPDLTKNVKNIHTLADMQPFLSIYELRQLVSLISDLIYSRHAHDRLKLYDTILMLFAFKIADEMNNADNIQLPKLLQEAPATLTTKFKQNCTKILTEMGCESMLSSLVLDGDLLHKCLKLLAPYSFRLTSLLGIQTEVLGTFYQEVVSSTFRGSLGAYFTPKPIADLASSFCEATPEDTVLDTSCGSGTFLLSAVQSANNNSHSRNSDKRAEAFGCDIQERMVLTTSLNAILHGIDKPHVIHKDALRLQLSEWHAHDPSVPPEGFSLIVGNPPFAGFESATILPYEHESEGQRGAGMRVNKVVPFIARTVQLLKPGGRAALVIPVSVLNGEAASFVQLRKWLSSQVEVTAILGLPRDAFVHTDCGVEGALLFFRRIKGKQNKSTKVFFKTISNVGYDRRGKVTSTSEIEQTINEWKRMDGETWITLEDLYNLERWDPTWLHGNSNGMTKFNVKKYVKLTEICDIAKRNFSPRQIESNMIYRCFEVGDTDIDTGIILHTHAIKGSELVEKGRLRVRVQTGDILLPNHRDSLIAKTSSGVGRAVVVVTEKEDGFITSNRFTVLRPRINPKLLTLILNSRFFRHQLALYARGSASFDIRDKVLEEVWIPRMVVDDNEFQKESLAVIERREEILRMLHDSDKEMERVMSRLDT